MKKIVLAICLVSSLTINLAAQPQTRVTPERQEMKNLSPEERAKKSAEKAEKGLALSPDQKIKWESAALEKAKANASLHEKMKGCTTPEQRKEIHSEMRLNKDKFNTTVVSMLSPEQKAKHEQMKKDRKNHMHKMKKEQGSRSLPENNAK